MSARTTKHTTVMRRSATQRVASREQFHNSDIDDATAPFDTYEMPAALWEEMGCPQTITLSVEYGDRLNHPAYGEPIPITGRIVDGSIEVKHLSVPASENVVHRA